MNPVHAVPAAGSGCHRRHRDEQSGFTLVEVVIVLALLLPALALVATCTDATMKSLSGDDATARTMENLQRSSMRIAQVVRPCSLATLQMLANQDDVTAGTAAAIGDWIEPPETGARTGIRFRSATGEVAMNAAALTPWRSFRFRLDPREVANGVDDDGDGLVDEGRVVMDYDGTEVALATDVERVEFSLVDRSLTIELRAAVRRRDGVVLHFTTRAERIGSATGDFRGPGGESATLGGRGEVLEGPYRPRGVGRNARIFALGTER